MKFKILFTMIALSSLTFSQWMRVQEIPETSNVPSFFIEGQKIYAGADSVIYISTDAGETWISSNRIFPDVDFVSAIIKYNNRIFAGTYNYGVFETTDNGINWIERNNGLIGPGAKTISDFVIRDNKLYASTYGSGIFLFDLNINNNWETFNNGIPSNLSYNVNSLTLNNGILYAGAGGNGFYYTNNPGSQDWIEHQFGMIISEPLSFYDIIFPAQNQIIVSSYGLYKSTDNGNSWYYLNTGSGYLTDGNFISTGNDIIVAMTKSSKTLWLKSSDGGNEWQLWDENLGAITLNTIFINGKIFDGRLNGLWYRTILPNAVDDNINPDEFVLHQNYPNPFNPSTRISFTIGISSIVSLKVYDVLGREVADIINEFRPAGNYEIEFNAGHLSSRIYYYVLSTEKFSSVKKMILIR